MNIDQTATFLVTGGTGFIGRYARAELSRQSLPTVVLARRVTSRIGRERVLDLAGRSTAEWLDQASGLQSATLIHIAWGNLPNYTSEWHVEHELPMQIITLEAAARAGVRRIVVTGTCFEYGAVSGCISEDQPLRPTTKYGEAKARLMDACMDIHGRLGVELTWLRLFFPFGDGQRQGSLFGQIEDAEGSSAREIQIEHPNLIRDFISVDQVARVIVAAAVTPVPSVVMNVGSGVGQTVFEHAQQIVASRGWKVAVSPAIEGLREPRQGFWADVRRLNAWHGGQVQVDV